jgi:hypothetical protein
MERQSRIIEATCKNKILINNLRLLGETKAVLLYYFSMEKAVLAIARI